MPSPCFEKSSSKPWAIASRCAAPSGRRSLRSLLTGVVAPALQDGLLSRADTIMMLYVVFPCMLAASVCGDAFAGERERRTLETLLATPLSEFSILVGKLAAAVCFVLAVSGASFAAGLATVSIRGFAHPAPSLGLALGVAGSVLAGSLIISAATIAISMRVAVARSAYQMGSILTLVLAGIGATVIQRFGKALDWPAILRADVVLFFVGLLGLAAAVRSFRRDRFFDKR